MFEVSSTRGGLPGNLRRAGQELIKYGILVELIPASEALAIPCKV